jgi:hypothetical protein
VATTTAARPPRAAGWDAQAAARAAAAGIRSKIGLRT